MRSKYKKKMKIIVLTLIYIAASFVFLDLKRFGDNILKLRHIIIFLGLLYFIICYLRNNMKRELKLLKNFKIKNYLIILLWSLFSITVILSQSINLTFPIEGIAYLIINPLFFIFIIPITLDDPLKDIITAGFLSSFIVLMFSIYLEPINFFQSYRGITINPNSIGQIATQAGLTSFSLFINLIKSKDKKHKKYLYLLFFIISLGILFTSYSRTSFVTLIITVIITLILYLNLSKVKLYNLLIPISIATVIYFSKLEDYLEMGILSKFSRLANDNNVLNNRTEIWKSIFNDVSIFGHGIDYFDEVIGKGAHNSVISMMGAYGILSGILIGLLFLISLIYSFNYAIQNKKKDFYYVPLVISFSFVLTSMAESMFGIIGKSMTLMYFNILGVIIFEKINSIKINKV